MIQIFYFPTFVKDAKFSGTSSQLSSIEKKNYEIKEILKFKVFCLGDL